MSASKAVIQFNYIINILLKHKHFALMCENGHYGIKYNYKTLSTMRMVVR